jgi:hypothetical protein
MKAFSPIAFLSLGLLLLPGTAAEREVILLDIRIVGSSSSKTEPSFGTATGKAGVQRLLLDLTSAPRQAAQVDLVLQGTGLSRADLVKLRLLRRQEDRYVPDIPVYTSADLRRIRAVTKGYGESLASAFLARRSEIEGLLGLCAVAGVDPQASAFIVLGCVSMDWDGLELAAKKGYRTTQKRPDGRYGAWAEEKSDLTLDRLYWSSGTPGYGDALFVSFGDGHASFLPGLRHPLKPLDASRVFQQAGRFLLALRDGDRSLDELGSALKITPQEAQSLAGLLVNLEFATQQNGRYQAHIPVFSRRDRKRVQQLRRIGQDVMQGWLAGNYEKLKADLSFTAPGRWGVPYTEEFNAIWHYVFGFANQRLVEAGLFADPYSPARKYKGDIPAVFEDGVL